MRRLVRWAYRVAASWVAGSNITAIPAIAALNRIVTAWLRQPEAMVHGHRMRLDPDDCMNLSILKIHEPQETALLERIVQPGWVAADIGANIGYFSLVMARAVGRGGTVVAFEPEPANAALLRENVALNGYTNIVVESMGVAASPGEMTLFRADGNTVDHRVYDAGDARRSIAVPVTSLDDYFRNANRLDLVKVDVQGAEALGLDGMRDLFSRGLPRYMLIEFWPEGLQRAGADPAQILDTLQRAGFRLCDAACGDDGREIDTAQILATCTPANGKFVNLICTREGSPPPGDHNRTVAE